MASKDLIDNFRLTVHRSLRYSPYVSIRRWYQPKGADEMRPGLPGMELTTKQFHQLGSMLPTLEQLAAEGRSACCLLGGNRMVEVGSHGILLRRLPTALGPVIPARHELAIGPQLWQSFWRQRDWVDRQLYEAGLDTQPMPTSSGEESEEDEPAPPPNQWQAAKRGSSAGDDESTAKRRKFF
jgi:hypothetical protein